MKRALIQMISFLLGIILVIGCAGTGPLMKSAVKEQDYIPNADFENVVVSNFFETSYFSGLRFDQLPYYDTENYIYWQTSGQDISGIVSQYFGGHGLSSKGMKNFPSTDLSANEIMVSGVFSSSNMVDIKILHIPLFFILVGNVLPNPAGYTSGANINYRYEIIDNQSNIVYQSGTKTFSIGYKHYWVWGSMFKRDKHYDDATEQAREIVLKEIATVLEKVKG